jgi:hypothetical protein
MMHLLSRKWSRVLPAALLLCSQVSFGQQRIVDYEAICISPADTVVNGVGALLRFQKLNHGPDVGHYKDTVLYWLYVIEGDQLHWSYSGATIGTTEGIIEVGESSFYKDNYAIRFPFPGRKDTFTVDFCVVVGSTYIKDGDTISPFTWIDPNSDNDMCCTKVTIVPKPSGTSVPSVVADAELTMYPNPANEVLHIRVQTGFGAKGIRVDIRDVSGRQVSTRTLEQAVGRNDLWSLNVGQLPEGIYQVRLQASEGVVTRKLLISR